MSTVTYSKLGDVAQYLRGINFKPDDVVAVGAAGTVACMRTKNIQESLDCADVWAVAETFVRRPKQILQEGDLLVSSANSWNLVGKCCWIPKLPWKSTFGGFVSALRADPQKINPRFLYWWFSSDRTQALLRSFGQKTTSISNLNSERCLNLDVPLLAIPEQRRIAAILDQADELRTKRRETLAQLDSLTQSIFIEMFGAVSSHEKVWPTVQLHEAAEVLTGYAFKSDEYVSQSDESIRLCRGTNVLPGRIDWSDMACWRKSDAKQISAFNLEVGDIVMAMDRPWISEGFKIARISSADCPALLVQRVARVRAKASSSNDFLYEVLKQPEFTQHCRPTETTIPHISPKEIKSFTFGLPPADLQREFSRRVSEVHRIRQNFMLSASHADALFASLQHRAFLGEL